MSTLVVSIERRFDRSPDGSIWVPDVEGYGFWKRYLDVFDSVRVVARVRAVPVPPPGACRSDGDRVSFHALPYYVGPWQYLLRARKVKRAAQAALRPDDAVILRVDSQIAACLHPHLVATGRPFGVEVVVDPYDCFAPGAIEHPLRPFFRWKFARQLRRQCRDAAAAAYVTERALQERYPPSPLAFTTHYSSVDLPASAFVDRPGRPADVGGPRTLITVGSLGNLRKGQDVLLDALAACVREGLDLRLNVVGEGRLKSSLEGRARELGLEGHVTFMGQVEGDQVRNLLDRADLFVLPSRGEGLPRALLEAMARALPAIGSAVGGFPEVLPQDDLVPPGDSRSLAAKLAEVLGDPSRRAAMSARNLKRSRDFSSESLTLRRRSFYLYLRSETERRGAELRGARGYPPFPARDASPGLLGPHLMEMEMNSRMQHEAEFHDHLREEAPFQRYSREAEEALKDDSNWSNFKWYSIEQSSRRYVEEWIRTRCRDKRLLDFCCGNGDDSIFAAKNGASAVGIDISPVSIENGKKKAAEEGLGDRAQFFVMNAEALTFGANSFDLVVVYGVLHHLDFAKAMSEISRVLKPMGAAICTEALAHNPLIHAYRKKTPHLRTPWEVDHILRKDTIDSAGRWFGKVETRFYHLATLAAVPFRKTFLFKPILDLMRAVDWVLLAIPWVRWQAWQCVFELSEPRKETPGN